MIEPTETYVRDPIRKLVWTIPVSTEALEDAEAMRPYLREQMRRVSLARLGFLGLVRCARCHRKTRCVEWMRVRGVDELLGTSCFRIRWRELVGEPDYSVEV